MESAAMHVVQKELYMIIIVLLIGLLILKLAEKLNVPDVALYILMGIIIGPEVFNLVYQPENSVAYQFIIIVGSVLILFEGGQAVRIPILQKVWITVGLLAVLGVAVTAAVIAIVAMYVFDIPFLYALLLASVIASTDPATLIPVFKQVPVREKVRRTVESESAFNDATGSILTFTVLGLIAGETTLSISSSIWEFVKEAGGGFFIGILVGYLGILLTSTHRFGVFHQYGNMMSLLVAVGSYWLADAIGASGFMATFTAGIVCGNPKTFGLELKRETVMSAIYFNESLTLLSRTLIFILLGTQVRFDILLQYWQQGLIIALSLIFIARPLTVLACALPDRRASWSWREILFMFWVRETGVIPAALSGLIVASGIKYADIISSVTFITILVTIILQATTTGLVAKWLRLTEEDVVKVPHAPVPI